MQPSSSSRIDQSLTLAGLALLIIGCFLVLKPFMTALLWAAILCTTAWPLYQRLLARLRGHATLAALVMVLGIAVILLAPFIVVGATIADNADRVALWWRALLESGPPEPPAWVAHLPLIGERAAAYWGSIAHDTAQVVEELRKYVEPARKFALASGATFARRRAAAHAVDLHRVLLLPRRRASWSRGCAAPRAHRARARLPARGRRARRPCAASSRHPRHRARAGRARGDRAVDRGHQGGAAARAADVLPVAGADRPAARLGAGRTVAHQHAARPAGASSCSRGARWSCRRSTTC